MTSVTYCLYDLRQLPNLSKLRLLHVWNREYCTYLGQVAENGCIESGANSWLVGHYHAVIETSCLLMILKACLRMALTIPILYASKLEFDLYLYQNLWNLNKEHRKCRKWVIGTDAFLDLKKKINFQHFGSDHRNFAGLEYEQDKWLSHSNQRYWCLLSYNSYEKVLVDCFCYR